MQSVAEECFRAGLVGVLASECVRDRAQGKGTSTLRLPGSRKVSLVAWATEIVRGSSVFGKLRVKWMQTTPVKVRTKDASC